MTYGKAIDDILLRIYQGSISDDSELSRSQVLSWLQNSRDAIVQEFLNAQLKAGAPIDTFYQERLTSLDAEAEEEADTPDEDERIYITLTKQPMVLYNDMGVQRVITEDGVMLDKSRSESIDWVKDLKYGKPTFKRPVWYRDNRKIILEGVSYKNLNTTYIVYYVPTASSQALTETDELKIADELLDPLLAKVEAMARQEIYNTTADLENDGTDIKPQ